MNVSRDFGAELDVLSRQMGELQRLVNQIVDGSPANSSQSQAADKPILSIEEEGAEYDCGGVFYSGHYQGDTGRHRWELQERRVKQLLALDGEKAAKILTALGHKQRLDILRSVLKEPLSGSELVERLNMGTTGQLYHHIKALLGANLLVQEERGGLYSLPPHRALPLLLLLAAASDLLDTSDYIDLTETRSNAGAYLGNTREDYDPHHLLWAVLENCILEHQAGACSEADIFLQGDGSITVSDNGRGIPVQILPGTEKSRVQAVLTELNHFSSEAFNVPGGEKGINIAVVNALCSKLSVDVRRDGKIYRQDYKHGIPQSGLLTVGVTVETGTSITFIPDREIFRSGFDRNIIAERMLELSDSYPELILRFN